MKPYETWLAKLRKRARPSGSLSQWAEVLAAKDQGDPAIWREHLRAVLEEGEKASLDLILDLDLITAPARREKVDDGQADLW